MRQQFEKEESAPTLAGGGSNVLRVRTTNSLRGLADPRAIVTVVMERMNLVNARKDELSLAIHGLADITEQLTRTYADQRLAIEQLRRRVKALETGSAAEKPSSRIQ